MICGSCGADRMERFDQRTLEVAYKDEVVLVPGMSGWHCLSCDDMRLDPTSMTTYAAISDELVLKGRS